MGHVRSFVRRNAGSAGRASRQSRDSPTGSGGPLDTPTLTPQSKPVTHASRLVAQKYAPLVAFGLGPGILAAGPVTYRQYSLSRRLCEPDLSSFVGSTGTGHRANQALRPSPEAPPNHAGRRQSIDDARRRSTRTGCWNAYCARAARSPHPRQREGSAESRQRWALVAPAESVSPRRVATSSDDDENALSTRSRDAR